ncbi:hypothetical protein ACFL07_00010 [Pseudomonadota bacterium]
MIQTLIIAVFKAGIPVALASFGLIWWALKNDYLDSFISVEDLEKQIKQQSKNKKNREKGDGDLVHNKWLAFGGGFYGVVALLTYVVVELREIWEFFVQFESISAFFAKISFGMLIGLVIDAIMNFVLAIAWPWYWLTEISPPHIWIWFVVAYGGYWAGTRLALRRLVEPGENGEP